MTRMSVTRSRAALGWSLTVATGLAVAVLGTFLPWFRSGTVTRDSYETTGLVAVFGLAGDAEAVLTLWTAVPLLCAVCAALLLTRLRRTAAVTSLATALVMGTVAVAVAVQAGEDDGPIGITATGPVVTATGTGLAIVAAVGVLVSAAASRRRTRDRAGRP
ncbi:hypothetical protein JD82_01026 [Prauserella rugosa]|uniref:Tryptophan-associated transmembrane protein n=2 Tax=Prauserella rugosa TaxID=43354 RepID=A0A660CBR8_9PSEU|nr:hypothetical protein HQ32_01213 [Prauserella sp. Am3]TWH19203.1 hypothetical protein JD82_01026 [Prauserella rugosa]